MKTAGFLEKGGHGDAYFYQHSMWCFERRRDSGNFCAGVVAVSVLNDDDPVVIAMQELLAARR